MKAWPPTFSHLGVAVANVEDAVEFYRRFFGYATLSDRVDDPVQQASVCFVGSGTPGDLVIEVIAPLGAESPVSRILAKGAGAYHVCYTVADLEHALVIARDQGCLIVAQPVPAVAFGGRRIAWLYTPTRQLVELLEA